jgi:hypothetical protein
MKITTFHEFSSNAQSPYRSSDWSAIDDSTYDGPGCPVGWGATEEEAIRDLLEQIEERTDENLRLELEGEGYKLRYNDQDKLELFEVGGGYQTTIQAWERSTGNTFDSVYEVHRYVFNS